MAVKDPRYDRLMRYTPLGDALARWQQSCCAVVGLGGLGGGLALQLARMGVRKLLLLDRDTVGMENLGHQALYTEQHARERWPKAEAAATTIRAVNCDVEVIPLAASLDYRNIRGLFSGTDLLFDGLDNYSARFLLNDYAIATNTPYFHAGVVRGELSAKAIIPGVTGCLRCLLESPPPAGSAPTCAGEGVFPPLLGIANALQLDLANRYLANRLTGEDDVLYSLALPDWTLRKLKMAWPRAGCACCGQQQFDYLDGMDGGPGQAECTPGSFSLELPGGIDLDRAVERLSAAGLDITRNSFCLVVEQGKLTWTIFPSGRIIQNGDGDAIAFNRFIASYLGV